MSADSKMLQKCVINFQQKQTTIEVNRNILNLLLSYSINHQRLTDFTAALCFLLSPVPLSLITADGSRREKPRNTRNTINESCATFSDPR